MTSNLHDIFSSIEYSASNSMFSSLVGKWGPNDKFAISVTKKKKRKKKGAVHPKIKIVIPNVLFIIFNFFFLCGTHPANGECCLNVGQYSLQLR